MNIILFQEHEWGLPLAAQDERALHLRDILKAVPGDLVRVGLLDRGLGMARLAAWEGKVPVLEFPDPALLDAGPPALPLHVLLGHPRPPVFQRLLKDMASLGVGTITALKADLTEASYLQSSVWKDDSWRNYLVQGAQQGGLAGLPRLEKSWSLKVALEKLPRDATLIVMDLEAGCPLFLDWCAGLHRLPGSGPVVLALGPERGWTQSERQQLKERGFRVMSLGKTILRTEMACILACGMAAMALTKTPDPPPDQGCTTGAWPRGTPRQQARRSMDLE